MEQLLISETKKSYYDYVKNISNGCLQIANKLRTEQYINAFNEIMSLSEGLSWLLQVEQSLAYHGFKVNSRIVEANEFLMEINVALEQNDFVLLADIFEYELSPLFDSATEWVFEVKVG